MQYCIPVGILKHNCTITFPLEKQWKSIHKPCNWQIFLCAGCYPGLLVKSFSELVLAAHALQAGLGTSRTTSASSNGRSALKMLMKVNTY